jgi:two-component system sensor kinase FixL
MNTNLTVGSSPDRSLSTSDLQALLRLQDRLMNVSRLATMGEMTTGIAHELNQPLAAIANYAQACDRLLGLPDPEILEIRDALKQITSQAVRAGEIIRRLRNLSRSEGVHCEQVDINEVVGELIDLVQSDARHHNVRCALEFTPRLPQVNVDRAQVQQVVLNLVRNALEALVEVAPSAREVTVRTALGMAGDVELCVSDNGPGVSPSILDHLFDPFCTTKAAGTGLGLAMSRTIARAHHGTLDYRRNESAGATFVLKLPPVGPGPVQSDRHS